MGRIVKLYEDFGEEENGKYESHWEKLFYFLNKKGFDLYGRENDIEEFFKDIANNVELSPEEKAESISGFLDNKLGTYDGYSEIYDFIEGLFSK